MAAFEDSPPGSSRTLKTLRSISRGVPNPLIATSQLNKMTSNGSNSRLASWVRRGQLASVGSISSDMLRHEGGEVRPAIIRRVAMGLIHLYQLHVSPRKGFSCPYREVHDELSCSSYVSRLLQMESSFAAVVSKSFARFQDCAGASTQLASQNPRMKCWVLPCCLPL